MNQKRVGGDTGLDRIIHINRAGSIARAPFFQVLDLTEPEVGLRLADHRVALNASLVGSEYQLAIPKTEVWDVTNVAGNGLDPCAAGCAEGLREFKEHAVHIHEQILVSDVAYTWPFGEPAMFGIIIEASFGKQEGLEISILHDLQAQGTFVPADRPDGIILAIGSGGNTLRAGDLGVLAAFDDLPGLAIEGGEAATIFRALVGELFGNLPVLRAV